jgi:hypothetical protein
MAMSAEGLLPYLPPPLVRRFQSDPVEEPELTVLRGRPCSLTFRGSPGWQRTWRVEDPRELSCWPRR